MRRINLRAFAALLAFSVLSYGQPSDLESLRVAADRGDAKSAFTLAQKYEKGDGTCQRDLIREIMALAKNWKADAQLMRLVITPHPSRWHQKVAPQ